MIPPKPNSDVGQGTLWAGWLGAVVEDRTSPLPPGGEQDSGNKVPCTLSRGDRA
jgi:hypothetical protein